jgi:hypothetical protein
MPTGLNPSFACKGFLPLCSQGRTSSARYHVRRRVQLSAAGICWEWCWRSAPGCCTSADGYHSLNDGDAIEYTIGIGGGGPNCAYPRHRGRRWGCVQLHPAAHSGGDGGGFWAVAPVRRRAKSSASSRPPRVVGDADQDLHEIEAAILREWETLEAEHQRLSDWRTQLEERTKAASHQFASDRSELERDHTDYKKDLQKVYTWEMEASRKEKRLAKREEAFNQREEVVTEL